MGLKSFLINNLLEKFLTKYGYVDKSTNMDLYARQKVRELVVFWLDTAVSGLLIHFSLFFAYYFLKVNIPLKVQPFLVLSYGLFFHFFMNWLPKAKTNRGGLK